MEERLESPRNPLPPPWDRIFGLGTRLFVWGSLAACIYLLRPFFLLIFLTFVFAYIQGHGVEGLQQRFSKRWVRVVLVFTVFLGTWVAVGYFLAPHVEEQVKTIAEEYPKQIKHADTQVKEWLRDNGLAERFGLESEPVSPGDPPKKEWKLEGIVANLLGFFGDEGGGEGSGKTTVDKTIEFMKGATNWILAVGSAFLLALLFSFLIVLDLPRLTRGVRGLAKTKVGFIYTEVAGSIYSFGKVLGRAMEAQFIIAICNTILTAVGLWIIGVGEGNLVFLCTVVFLCSFIPVAGVFFSSTPICIAALTEGGFGLMLAAIAMILIIHAIEAYILNPRIYGHHLRMNPVLTLIILTLCGKLFGPWGLILGIPVFNYIFTHAIRYKPPADANSAAPGQAA